MFKLITTLIIVIIILLVSFIVIDSGTDDVKTPEKERIRRYLGFRNITNFYCRLNFKANMVPWNQIFAQALGFRMNFMDPPDSFHPYRHLHRRDVYNGLELLFDKNKLNGFHCIRRTICELNNIEAPTSIYYKILKIVFRKHSGATEKWHNATQRDCVESTNTCPISLLDLSLFTDI